MHRNLRIIYLHQYFNTPQMAGSTRSYEMARRLVDAGHEVHMVTSNRNSNENKNRQWYKTIESGIQVHWIQIPYSNNLRYNDRVKAFFKFAIKASTKAASLVGDVVFVTSTPLSIAIPGIFAAKLNRIPMVFEVRDLWPNLPIAVGAIKNYALIFAARQLEMFAYRSSTRIVALSPGMKEGIVATGYPSENVTIIPNSCNMELFDVSPELGFQFRSKYPWLDNRPLVVYAGTLGIINGVENLVSLAKAVGRIDPEVRFLIVGTGMEKEKVRETAKKLCVFEQNFFMMEKVPKIDIPKILCAADIATSFVINIRELWHNSANKFFDALASGTPVAINYGGWQADLLRKSGAGIVLDLNKMQMARTAKNLVRKIRDKKWLKHASIKAKKLAHEEFSIDVLATKLEQVLVDAVEKRIK